MANPGKRPSFFKRKYLIVPQFQSPFLIQVSGMTLFILVGFKLIEIYLLEHVIRGYAETGISSEGLFLLLRNQIDYVFAVKTIFLVFTLLLWSLLFSHRVAGPMYRFEKIMDEIIKGDEPETFVFRKNDFFTHLGEKLKELYDKKILNK